MSENLSEGLNACEDVETSQSHHLQLNNEDGELFTKT